MPININLNNYLPNFDGTIDERYPAGDKPGGGGGWDSPYNSRTPDYFVSSTGDNGNAGTSEGAAWATLTYAYSQASAGDIIGVVDGLTEQLAMTTLEANPGTLANHIITVGKDLYTKIDGFFTNSGAGTNAYHQWEGLHFDGLNATSNAFPMSPQYMKVISCIFEATGGAIVGNNTLHGAGSNQLYESVGFIGNAGRYTSICFERTNTLYRRCLVRTEANNGNDGDPTGAIQIYSCTNCELQQCIGVDCLNTVTGSEFLGSFIFTSNVSPGNSGCKGVECIASDSAEGLIQIEGNFANDTALEGCVAVRGGTGIFSLPATGEQPTVDNCTAASNTNDGIARYGSGGTLLVSNCNSSGNGSENYRNIVDGGGNTQTAVDIDALLSAIKLRGVDGTYRGETGWDTVQAGDLFPFPQEDDLRTVFRVVSQRGFCADGQTLTTYLKRAL